MNLEGQQAFACVSICTHWQARESVSNPDLHDRQRRKISGTASSAVLLHHKTCPQSHPSQHGWHACRRDSCEQRSSERTFMGRGAMYVRAEGRGLAAPRNVNSALRLLQRQRTGRFWLRPVLLHVSDAPCA